MPMRAKPWDVSDGGWRSGAEEVDQLAPLPLAQTGKRLRVSDPTVGKDASGLDRADLRQYQEDIAHSRCPHTRGWVGEDLHQLDLSRRELLLQLRSCRPNFVRLFQRTQPLLARSARNARTGAALCHAAILEPEQAAGQTRQVGRSALRPSTAHAPGCVACTNSMLLQIRTSGVATELMLR